jgi:hypothetical protein
MSEQPSRLGRCIVGLKTAAHHEKYIHILRIGLSSNVATEDDESLQATRAPRQLIDVFQSCCDGCALSCAATKVRDDIGKLGPMEANG